MVLIDRCAKTLSGSQLSGTEEKTSASEEFLKDLNDEVLFPLNRTNRFKSQKEVKFLEEQFARDPTWNRETVQICKKALKLKTDQIYKWGYDRKKKISQQNENNEAFLPQDQKISLLKTTIPNEIIDISTLIPISLNKIAKRMNMRETPKEQLKEKDPGTVNTL